MTGTDGNGRDKKRLTITTKETSPGEMFGYFKSLLKGFPSHQFRASWQHKQFKALMANLPLNHACCVRDYSEHYACRYQEAQSLYFAQTQASLHVTILYRHSSQERDGVESTKEEPKIITEQLFVISPDLKHDHHSVHKCRELLADHLKECGKPVEVLHEWTDGCSAQYKSRHCMGDVSKSVSDFGFTTIRNYIETSHAKGSQDGAGANIKHMADLDVIRKKVRIQNANDLYNHTKQNFCNPARSSFPGRTVQLSKRFFFYVDHNSHNRAGRSFKEIPGNRAIHSVMASNVPGSLQVRHLSCYCCNCIDGNYEDCCNKAYVEQWKVVQVEQEAVAQRPTTRLHTTEERDGLKSFVSKNSTVAIAAAEQGEDYYLLKITSDGTEVLTHREKDDYSSYTHRAGSEVFRGNFYDPSQDDILKFSLDETKLAIVHAETVCFICTEVKQCSSDPKMFEITEKEHSNILDCLSPV